MQLRLTAGCTVFFLTDTNVYLPTVAPKFHILLLQKIIRIKHVDKSIVVPQTARYDRRRALGLATDGRSYFCILPV